MSWGRRHTQLSLPGSALRFMSLISAGLFTPQGNFQALFSYAYFPVNHMNTRTPEHMNTRTSEKHPFQSAPWCCVMCPNSRNTLWALGRSAKAVLTWASGPHLFCPHCLLLSLKGWLIWAASSGGSIWAPSQDTSMGWGRRLSKKG